MFWAAHFPSVLLSGSSSGGIYEGSLAGAEGFEPSPSSLTVRCPTSWTTPQRLPRPRRPTPKAETAKAHEQGRLRHVRRDEGLS
jgi:hypothetical protein